jgi:prepilin-type N-terminal cleavage/methylation domain-containing protein
MRPASPLAAGRRGFTLIELLIALGILSFMLVALFTFVFSMGEIWGRGSDQRLFQQHVNTSSRHLEELLRRGISPLVTPVAAGEPYSVHSVRGADGGSQDLLTFTLPEGDRLFSWPGDALPEVTCSLGLVTGRGLMLYWQSTLELNHETEPPRTVQVSPFVTKLEYLVYAPDSGSWRTDTRLQRGADSNWILPDRIRLTYAYGSLTEVREITLPAKAGEAPAY